MLLDLVKKRILVITLSSVLHTNEIGSQIARALKQKKQHDSFMKFDRRER